MLKVRLRRMGARNAPFYRVVISDSRKAPTASAVEELGHYNPRRNPPEVVIDAERVRYWVSQGALLSPTVEKLMQQASKAAAAVPAEAAAAVAAPAETPESAEAG